MNDASSRRDRSLRRIAGMLALGALLLMALFIPRWGGLREKALVDADQTFRLASLAEGSYSWSLRKGWPAEGEALVREQVLQPERADLVELEINPELQPGQVVEQGQVVAWLRSGRDARLQAEIASLRAELDAQRALLTAGGRPEEVEQARQQVRLAQAAWDGQQPELARVRALHAEGAASDAELEAAEVRDRLLAVELQVAQARQRVAGSSARPEALAAVDAQMAALDARAAELEARLAGETVRSPITGLLEMGGRRMVLRIYDLDPVYLRLVVPERERHHVEVGTPVRFASPAVVRTEFSGTVVDIGEDADTVNGAQVFWVSVEVPNPDLALRSGMSGVARIELGSSDGPFAALWAELMGFGS
ncbi:MAG: efflux RND transporter periplasmic adaptor subunit [Pseudomonadota bacterium]